MIYASIKTRTYIERCSRPERKNKQSAEFLDNFQVILVLSCWRCYAGDLRAQLLANYYFDECELRTTINIETRK